MSLKKIVYVSSATHLLERDELRTILHGSRSRNEVAGVTGMLLYHEGSFMQVLEGPPEIVDALDSRIVRDDRHRRVVKLLEWLDDERLFPDWSMGFKDLDRLSVTERDGAEPYLESSLLDDAYRAHPDRARRLLLTFKQNAR